MTGRSRGRLTVEAAGPLALVEDRGRPGLAHLGLGRSGAADRAAHDLANRLVGNDPGAATIEATLGGLAVGVTAPTLMAVTGASVPVRCGGRERAVGTGFYARPGDRLEMGTPTRGLRSYLAVRGGVVGRTVLGSMSWDTLARLGTPPLRPGDELAVGDAGADRPATDLAPTAGPGPGRGPGRDQGPLRLPLLLGPRADWFTDAALALLAEADFTVSPDTDRVGARVDGPVLERARDGELDSEGLVTGALQVPPDGRPTLFLADHPVTGGYPVLGVVPSRAISALAQAAPGRTIRFRIIGA